VLLVEYLPMYGLMAWEIWKRRPLLEDWAYEEINEKKEVLSGAIAQG
jgi:hypothetical protein